MAKSPVNGKPVLDITTMSETEIQEYLKQRKQEQAKLIAIKGKEARKDVEEYCLKKWGLTLGQVWMASDNYVGPKTYKNPETGEVYTYGGRGKMPAWMRGPDGKINPELEVKD